MSEPSPRACPGAPSPPPTSCPTSPWGAKAWAAVTMEPRLGAREGTPGGYAEPGDCLREGRGGGGGCLTGGGAGAGAGSQSGGFVCEKNRGLARVGTLASLNANGAPAQSPLLSAGAAARSGPSEPQ